MKRGDALPGELRGIFAEALKAALGCPRIYWEVLR